jgi:DNA-binding NarL/FixJ family response regulator
MAKIRVLLADDHTMVVEAFRKMLEPEFEVLGIALDGRKLLELAPQLKPDVVLLDLGMPLLNGFDAGRQLKELMPGTKIIVVTMNEDTDIATTALREWASGYLLKSSTRQEVIKAITTVRSGRQYVTARIADRQFERFVQGPQGLQMKMLTFRQRQVLQLLAEGRSMKEAAAELQSTARAIAFHKYRIMEEYGLRTNVDLLRFAIEQHVVAAT